MNSINYTVKMCIIGSNFYEKNTFLGKEIIEYKKSFQNIGIYRQSQK